MIAFWIHFIGTACNGNALEMVKFYRCCRNPNSFVYTMFKESIYMDALAVIPCQDPYKCTPGYRTNECVYLRICIFHTCACELCLVYSVLFLDVVQVQNIDHDLRAA